MDMRADIIFLSLAKNCAATLPNFLGMISALRTAGLHCITYIGENDSHDGTNILLREAEKREEIVYIPTSFMAGVPNRLHRMALGRQKLKDELDKSGLNPRFICVVDLDTVIRQPPTVEAIHSAISKLARPDIFAVSATSRPQYYDILAYEDDNMSFEFLLEEIKKHQTNIFAYYRFFLENVYPFRRRLTSDREVFCTSAFNGMIIYKAEAYALGSYVEHDFRRCEHLAFNRRLAQKIQEKILIDPGLILLTPDDHGEEGFAVFAWKRLKKLLADRYHKLRSNP